MMTERLYPLKAIVLPSVEGQTDFIDLVSERLDQLQQIMTGAELIAAIENTGKSVTIYRDCCRCAGWPRLVCGWNVYPV